MENEDLQRKVLALEYVVETLLKDSPYRKVSCTNSHCQLGDGSWPDGGPCSDCGGVRFTLVHSPQLLEKDGDHQQGVS